jgi:outer membrane receptor protein involved in Fe transport
MRRDDLFGSTILTSGLILGALVATSTQAQAQQNPVPNASGQPAATSAATGNSSASSDSTDPATGLGVQGAVGNAGNEAIVVTGSRIARPELDTVQPTQVIGSRTIEARGYTNLTQALQELPSFGPAGNSNVGAQSSFGPSQSFVDFFGLGSQRTLTLVNGRRFVSSNTASIFGPVSAGSQVDLNAIPVTLIDRVDIVSVGGAPIYGSDAIAGTVNIILKKNYEGLQVGGEYGLSARGDAPDRRANILFGKNFGGGRGNIVVSGEYDKITGLVASDRAVSAAGNFFGTPPTSAMSATTRRLYPSQRYSSFTAGGVPFTDDDYLVSRAGIRNDAGQILQFGPSGTLVPLDLGTVLRQGYISSGGNGFDLPSQANLLTNSERYLGTALGSYELTDHVHAFGEAWYSHSTGTNLIDQPNYNTALFDAAGTADGNIIARINNPFLSAADRATIAANLPAGADTFYLGRALNDLTTGRSKGTVELYRFVGGFNGDFNIGQRNFTWEASANYGHSRATGHNLELVQQNFANAIDAVQDASGTITCRPGVTNATIATISETCAPLNIFGTGQASQAAKDYIFAVAKPVSVDTQLVFNANIQGSLFKLPGGDLKFSLGYEYRREHTNFDPGDYYYGEPQADGTRVQYGRTIPIDPISGGFHTNEVFGELVAPLISDTTDFRFIRTLELDGSLRYVDNSLAGGDITWTAGGRLGFFKGLTFRGNFTRSIRNPAITEVFNPTSRAFDVGSDPCDGRYVNSGPNPANRRANCIAAGITDPDNFVSNYSDFTIPISVSGNPNLSSEKANSWTAGAVVEPPFLPGFTLAVDWVNIELQQAIVSLGGDDILNACYDATSYPSTFCGAVDRDADGQITFIREGYYNAASYKFDGLQVQASYQHAVGQLGTFGVNVNYLYRHKLETRVGTGDIDHIAGEIGYPHHGGTGNITWQKGPFNALFQVIYVGKGRFDADDAPNARDIKGVGDWEVFNATVGYDINKQFGLKLIVDNIADRGPPQPFTRTYNEVQTYFSGIVGRSYRVSANIRF